MAKKVTFEMPDGFQWPEGAGDEIEVLATLTKKGEPSGRACLKEVDGYKLYDKDDRGYADAAADSMEDE